MYFIVLLLIFLSLLFFWFKRQLGYWKKRGIPYLEPKFIAGNLGESLLMRKHPGIVFNEIYQKFENLPFVGIYKGHSPCLLVRDPQLIKNILVQDFKSFSNNGFFLDKAVDPILARHHFFIKDEEWQYRRSQITPAFTPSKLKSWYPILSVSGQRMVQFINEKCENGDEVVLEAKEICTKFTLDNVAANAFGVEAKCFSEEKSYVRKMIEELISPGCWTGFMFIILTIFPWLTKYTNVKLVLKRVEDKILATISQSLQHRRKNNTVAFDFLDYVAKLKQDTKYSQEIDVMSHAANFAIDAVETSAIVMSQCLFELASNKDVQKKLREEINYVCEKYGGDLSYEAIQEMTYLHACVYESMRKNRIFGVMTKSCTKEYSYTSSEPDFKKLTVHLKPGDTVLIPLGIHTDPKYYPEPEKFKPERFLHGTSNNLLLVFGDGPRRCLGERFGLLQIKVGIAHVIRNFNLSVNPKTRLPFEYLQYYFLYVPKDGTWLNFCKQI